MAIVNRDKDSSEQKESRTWHKTLVDTGGGTFPMFIVPYACEVEAVTAAAQTLSGTPSIELEAYSFSGGVTINSDIMAALAYPAYSTSGIFASASLGTAGSTQVQLAQGDLLVATCTGANSAGDHAVVNVVLRALQDIKSHQGE